MFSSPNDLPTTPSTDSAALRPGRRVFQRYTLQRLVGRGGMGVVWLARDEKLDRPVALKFLPEVLFLDPAARDDLKRETRRSLELTHPHIIRIHDIVEDDEAAAIAMEYVDGFTLSQLRVERPSRFFEPVDLAVWTSALCSALAYAHESGRVVHRDLKPGNLMVSVRGVLKVADFGISCGLHNTAARVSRWSSTGGTLGYMSPQQLLGELASPSDDVYSIGATLYELLTSKPPFYSGDIGLQIREVKPDGIAARRSRLGLPGGGTIPPVWEETIAACLAKLPKDRPASVREIARRLGLSADTAAETLTENAPTLADGVSLPTVLAMDKAEAHETLAAVEDVVAPTTPIKRAWSEPILRYRWPIITALALIAAILPWFIRRDSSPGSAPLASANPPPAIAGVADDSAPPSNSRTVIPRAIPVDPVIPGMVPPAGAPASVPSSSNAADRLALLESPRPVNPAIDVPALPASGLQVRTTPAGVSFQVYEAPKTTAQTTQKATPKVAPKAKSLRSGETPATITDLPPGTYAVTFGREDAPVRQVKVDLLENQPATVTQEIPLGTVKVRSTPPGAEIVCDGITMGEAPAEWELIVGKHEFTAKLEGRTARVKTITLTSTTPQTVAFDFSSNPSTTAKSRSRRSRDEDEDDDGPSGWTRFGHGVRDFFTGKRR